MVKLDKPWRFTIELPVEFLTVRSTRYVCKRALCTTLLFNLCELNDYGDN